jgi:RNA polymerase sigma-70 factor (ECF subfamily)
MARIRQGDEQAFDLLLNAHEPAVRGRLSRIVRDHAAVEDLVQEVFLRLWSRAGQWDGRGSVAGWLLRIAVNLGLNHLRTVRRRRTQSLDGEARADGENGSTILDCLPDEDMPTPEEAVRCLEQQRVLARMVGNLPPAQQEVVRLAHETECDIAGIAGQLGIPPGTVKSRLHYARGKLADMWQRWQEHEENGL